MMQPRLKRRLIRHAASSHKGEGSWAVSYVDMLTLLLCFFIIFFKKDQLKKTEPSSATETQKAPSSPGQALPSPVIHSIVSVLTNQKGFYSRREVNEKSIELNFDHISFFDSGSTKVTPEGLAIIRSTGELLKPHAGRIRIIVQGHTDPRPIRSRTGRISDNWELSVIRATAVLKWFSENGFPQNLLSAEGFASNRTLASSSGVAEDLAIARRITIKVEDVAQ